MDQTLNVTSEQVGLPPADFVDPVIEAYKKDIDRTLLFENLKLTPTERIKRFQAFMDSVEKLKGAADRARRIK